MGAACAGSVCAAAHEPKDALPPAGCDAVARVQVKPEPLIPIHNPPNTLIATRKTLHAKPYTIALETLKLALSLLRLKLACRAAVACVTSSHIVSHHHT